MSGSEIESLKTVGKNASNRCCDSGIEALNEEKAENNVQQELKCRYCDSDNETLKKHKGEQELELKNVQQEMKYLKNVLFEKMERIETLFKTEETEHLMELQAIKDEVNGLKQAHRPEEDMSTLQQSSYSLMAASQACSLPWNLALLILAIQLTSFLLVVMDIIADGDPGNPFGVPANVSPEVRGIQLVALLIAVGMEEDLILGVRMLRSGFFELVSPYFEHMTLWKFRLSVISLITVGCIGILTSFVLIITPSTVIDLLLNFTALEFISHLDELVFFLSKMGILGVRCNTEVNIVACKKFPAFQSDSGLRKKLFLAMIMAVMLTGWLFIAYRQSSGYYCCPTLLVLFGDDYVPALGTFSGKYVMEKPKRLFQNIRIGYTMQESPDNKAFVGRFAYCDDDEINAWTFVVGLESDPCRDWIARSEDTKAYAITETLEWHARGLDSQRVVVLDTFIMYCYYCSHGNDCSGHGDCTGEKCDCAVGWHGLHCEFPDPCESLSVNELTDPFRGNKLFPREYKLFRYDHDKILEVYHRPVYTYEREEGTGDHATDVIFFTGRRWALATLTTTVSMSNISHFFEYDIPVAFLSEPTDFGTLTDTFSPVGLKWFTATSGEEVGPLYKQGIELEVSTRLHCQVCDDTNHCLFDGTCVDGACRCSLGSKGDLCEITPVSNGHCDTYFNQIRFEYDGGDCCEGTCSSSDDFVCGTENSGFVNTGYFFCHLPDQQWRPNGAPIQLDDPGLFPSLMMELSRNGQVLVVAGAFDPLGSLRIYDKEGPLWTLRASLYLDSVTSIAVGSGPHRAFNNPAFVSPLVVAVSHAGGVGVFECTTTFYECVPRELPVNIALEYVAISENSKVLAAVSSENQIHIFERMSSGQWKSRETLTLASKVMAMLASKVFSVSLSGNGEVLVAASCLLLEDDGDYICEAAVYDFYVWNGVTYSHRFHLRANEDLGWDTEAMAFEFDYPSELLSYGMEISEDGEVIAMWFFNCANAVAGIAVLRWRSEEIRTVPIGDASSTCEFELCDGEDCVDNPKKYGRVVLSPDGNLLAYRLSGRNDANILEWDGGKWIRVGEPLLSIEGGGLSMAVSADEIIVAASNPGIRNGGEITSYSFRRGCPEGTSLLRISLTLDSSPGETSWRLSYLNSSKVIIQGDGYSNNYAKGTVVEEVCIPTDSCIIYTIFDAGRDGLDDPGCYDLFLDSLNVGSGSFDHGTFKSVVVGGCGVCSKDNTTAKQLHLEPVIGNCSICECSDPFAGTFPTELDILASLKKLHIKDTDMLSGTIPEAIGLMTSLTSLVLSFGFFTGTMPTTIGLLTQLTSLIVDDNCMFVGPIPSELGLLTNLRELEFDENAFFGMIPTELGLLTKLEKLQLEENRLFGPIPSELALVTSLNSMKLEKNPNFTGTIPSELARLPFLEEFTIGSTKVFGTIPPALCGLETMDFTCSEILCGCNCDCLA